MQARTELYGSSGKLGAALIKSNEGAPIYGPIDLAGNSRGGRNRVVVL
jgi:hypothetical protein